MARKIIRVTIHGNRLATGRGLSTGNDDGNDDGSRVESDAVSTGVVAGVVHRNGMESGMCEPLAAASPTSGHAANQEPRCGIEDEDDAVAERCHEGGTR